MEASQTEGTPDQPDESTGPAVDPIEGSQGEQLPETEGGAEANRISAPPASAQSGVPPLPENEGVAPQPEYAGPVGDSGQSSGGLHTEANSTDNPEEGAAPEGETPAE